MKLNFEVISADDLESGDVFYHTPDFELNEFGPSFLLTGTDQIFIKDDYSDETDDGDQSIIVNGGWEIWFRPGTKVVRLFHYRDFIRVIEMVKEGNPDMELGPNDSITVIDDLVENNLLPKIDLLDHLPGGWLDEDGEDKKDREGGEEDIDLPF